MARKARNGAAEVEMGEDGVPMRVVPQPRVRTVRTETLEQVPVEADLAESAPDDDEAEPTALETLLEELGGENSTQLVVWRMTPSASNGRAYAGILPPGIRGADAIMSELQKKFGGGDFMLQMRDAGGTFARRIIVTVETPPEPAVPPTPPADVLAAAMKAALEPMAQRLASLENRPTLMQQIAPLLQSPIALALGQQLASRIFAAPPTPTGDLVSQLQSLAKVKDSMDALGMTDAEPSTAATLMKMFEQFGKPVLDRLATLPQVPANPRPAPVPVPAGAAPVVPLMPQPPHQNVVTIPRQPTTAGPVTMPAEIPEVLRPFVPVIVNAARSGAIPEVFAEQVLAAIPDDNLGEVKDSIDSGVLLAALKSIPALRDSGPWLDAVARLVSSGIVNDDEAEDGAGVSDSDGGGDASANTP